MRRRLVLALLLAAATVAGCASVPAESPVQIVRRVVVGEESGPPRSPDEGIDPLDLVREFVEASSNGIDRHAAARQYLLDPRSGLEGRPGWDDAVSVTVLESEFDTVPVRTDADGTRVRIRGTALGRLSSSGAFEADQRVVEVDVTLRQSPEGQWRIAELPDGVLVPLSYFRRDYRAVRSWFVEPARRLLVPDQRYIPVFPQAAQASRVLDVLRAGPSSALTGAVTNLLRSATLRSNVGPGETGELVVDLTDVGELAPADRELLAGQVLLALDEIGVARVRLSVDGVALLPDRPVLRSDDLAGLVADAEPGADVPGLVAAGGRLRAFGGASGPTELVGPFGNGGIDVESGASTLDGARLAVVARTGRARTLLLGDGVDGGVTEGGLSGGTMTRPTWMPAGTEVWTVLNGDVVARVTTDGTAPPVDGRVNAEELLAQGPVQDLRLSRDGTRVAAVVAGGLWTGAVTRSIDGEVAIRNVRRLRPLSLFDVVSADWRAADTIVVTTRRPEQERIVVQVTVDGLVLTPVLSTNLTAPLGTIAAAPNRPLLVADAGGVWSYGGGQQQTWRQILGGAPDAVPVYPG